MKDEKKYFNFPIVLLENFLEDDRHCLKNILDYAIYLHSLSLEYGDEEDKIKSSANFFNVSLGDWERTEKNGEILYESIPNNTPMVGMSLSVFWDYYKNDKTEFEKVTLLGFLAIKSILQKKAYCKITNNYWLSRMDGKAKSIEDYNQLSSSIKKYANEYQTKKIKSELRDYWSLVTYARYTRGFYVSLKLNLEQLIYEAEKRRKSTKEKQAKSAQKIALDKALKRLEV